MTAGVEHVPVSRQYCREVLLWEERLRVGGWRVLEDDQPVGRPQGGHLAGDPPCLGIPLLGRQVLHFHDMGEESGVPPGEGVPGGAEVPAEARHGIRLSCLEKRIAVVAPEDAVDRHGAAFDGLPVPGEFLIRAVPRQVTSEHDEVNAIQSCEVLDQPVPCLFGVDMGVGREREHDGIAHVLMSLLWRRLAAGRSTRTATP